MCAKLKIVNDNIKLCSLCTSMFPPDFVVEEQEEKGEDDSQDAQKMQREKMQLLVSAFSNAQQDQYEIFRRSTFPKSGIRKIMQSICGGTVPQNAVIAMAGITKVGSIVSIW